MPQPIFYSIRKVLSQRPTAWASAADLPGLPGVWAAVRYMTSLSAADTPLIRHHSRWILAADPEAGLQAFLQMAPPLDPATVLDILHQHSPDYCGMCAGGGGGPCARFASCRPPASSLRHVRLALRLSCRTRGSVSAARACAA